MKTQRDPKGHEGAVSRAARKHSVIAKILIIGVIVLLLLWPLLMFRMLVSEREQRRKETESEIMQAWGAAQTVAGPFLTVPYVARSLDANGKRVESIETARFLPAALHVEGSLLPERRSRGMYEVTVYSASLTVSGAFRSPDFSGWRISYRDILWDQAALCVELPDMRALQDGVRLSWGRDVREFQSARGSVGMFPGEIRAAVPGLGTESDTPQVIPFSFALALHGGDSISFLPVGDVTTVRISASGSSPNFNGSFLPVWRKVSAQGFDAEWRVTSIARAYPQRWRGSDIEPQGILAASFGVGLMSPIDTYLRVTRSLKYGLLFLVLPFCTLFLFEVFSRQRIHPVQYLLVGLADCIFYLLLLSLAEHVSFDAAYAVASAACTLLTTLYTVAVMKSRRGLIMLPVMAAAYGFLAVVLYSEDNALLLGSLGLFLLLAGVMFLTRKVDWYAKDRLLPESNQDSVAPLPGGESKVR